jgi:hypothetical protein
MAFHSHLKPQSLIEDEVSPVRSIQAARHLLSTKAVQHRAKQASCMALLLLIRVAEIAEVLALKKHLSVKAVADQLHFPRRTAFETTGHGDNGRKRAVERWEGSG